MPGGGDAWWRRLLGTRSAAAADTPPTAVGGRFVLRALLGHGATGSVYLADDGRTQAQVALKLVTLPDSLPAQARDDWCIAFAREALATARLRHADIVAMLDAGVVAEGGWLALEYVAGTELTRYTKPQHLLPEALVLRLGARIARALAHAHRAGIVHRDLKPSNVRVDLPRGVLKLTDFGIARLNDIAPTRTGLTLGTPAYMAPEQLRGDAAAAAADTWALGVLLFELLSGRRPLEASSLGGLLHALAHDEPADLGAWRPDLPAAVAGLVRQPLQREPAARPADLDAYADALGRQADALGGGGPGDDPMHNRPT